MSDAKRTTRTHPESKICTNCKEEKNISEFAMRGDGNHHSQCKTCVARKQKERVEERRKNGLCLNCGKPARIGKSQCEECSKRDIEKKTKKRKERKKEYKRKAVEYLGGKCIDCGLETDIFDVYDFHHLDPETKVCNISELIGEGKNNWATIRAELDKCVLLCANCHRIRGYIEREEIEDE